MIFVIDLALICCWKTTRKTTRMRKTTCSPTKANGSEIVRPIINLTKIPTAKICLVTYMRLIGATLNKANQGVNVESLHHLLPLLPATTTNTAAAAVAAAASADLCDLLCELVDWGGEKHERGGWDRPSGVQNERFVEARRSVGTKKQVGLEKVVPRIGPWRSRRVRRS